jgi:hypothetical protein
VYFKLRSDLKGSTRQHSPFGEEGRGGVSQTGLKPVKASIGQYWREKKTSIAIGSFYITVYFNYKSYNFDIALKTPVPTCSYPLLRRATFEIENEGVEHR